MKNIVKTIAILALSASIAQAQALKVGIVNMQDVLQGYYKSKQAQVELSQRRDDIKKDLDVRRAKLRDLTREAEDLQKLIRDESTTAEFRRLKMQEFETKGREANALARDLDQVAKQKERQLMLELERTFRGIRDEVKVVVDEISKKDGYDLVFDKSAIGMGGTPFLLFSKDAVDFTPSILEKLNADAPAELKNAPPAAPPAAPTEGGN
ncbi:MAG: OmpH family outer membrane protein [Verrucomicrobiales bacterium]